MEKQPNPDYEYYRRMVLKRRALYGTYGRLLALAGAFSILGLLLPALLVDAHYFLYTMQARVVFTLFSLGSLAAVILGIRFWQISRMEPSRLEIDQLRREQRARLFQQAQGALPWFHKRITRIVLTLFGLLSMLVGASLLVLFGWLALDGWGYIAMGLLVIALIIFVLPGERRKLPAESAGQLANHLLHGEVTEGNASVSSEDVC